jgi:[ribosomal protein S5]-alanine N-acetyltransferase
MIIETKRLLLKPYTMSIADDVFKVINNPYIADTMIMIPYPYPKESVNNWIRYLISSFESGTALEYAVFLKGDEPTYIGNAGFVTVSQKHQSAEIGYFIDEAYASKGYATEACEKLVHVGFQDLQLNRIYAKCMVRNTASQRVLKKIGMRHEGRFLQEYKKNNQFEDIDYFAILKQEYTL